ncbi:MAG: hypothetical protein IPH07_18355 [Deltaproteobacteria bacterium]|nr:hypothetical protein [Deltaproteobacteria bacterium]MBK8238780.1 hypothetical protein [Deltaproteobacteria bacterium]MBK8715664.1 hypothetical protein [Deltaproteobacteria bacterium]
MRPVTMLVGNRPIGRAYTWAYPYGEAEGLFVMPTYALTVEGTLPSGEHAKRDFEVFRFGVHCPKNGRPAMVGLAQQQTHVIKSWISTYTVHSADSPERGAWQVTGNFLIHDGPDNPLSRDDVYASIGCLEVCGGPLGFDVFNDFIIALSAPRAGSRDAQLQEIGGAHSIRITYLAATRPPLQRASAS